MAMPLLIARPPGILILCCWLLLRVPLAAARDTHDRERRHQSRATGTIMRLRDRTCSHVQSGRACMAPRNGCPGMNNRDQSRAQHDRAYGFID